MKTWLCNGCVFFLCCQVPKYAPSLRKKIKKFFQKERHTLGLILHIKYRAKKS